MDEFASLDRELLRARVRGLDDGDEVPRLVADDAAVAADVVGHEREDGGRRARASVGVDERGEELGRQERRVAGEDEHLLRVADRLARRANGVARPERALLHRDLQPVEGVGAVRRGDDDERRGTERLGGRDDPVDHPPPEDRVEVLRDRGAHTRPEPSGHHDCSESRRHHESSMAGAPGFEPGITGPKPVALPLGHAPAQGNGSLPGLPAVEQKGREGERRARDDCDRGEHDDGAGEHRHEHDDQLRDGRRPRDDPNVGALVLAPPGRVRAERAEREDDHEPPRDRAGEDEDALEGGDRERRP